jgi:hypothetical protein
MSSIRIDLSSLKKGPRQAANLNTGVFAKQQGSDNIAHEKSNEIHGASMSYFKSVSEREPCGQITLRDLIERIKGDADKNLVEKIRQEQDKNERGRMKKELSCVTVSGIVTTGGRAKAHCERRFLTNGLVACDFDAEDFAERTAEDVRALLRADKYVQAVFMSPSGGMKAIVRIPDCVSPGAHERAFRATEKHFLGTHGLKIDKSTKDSGRLTYLSHDPDAWLRQEPAEVTPIPSDEDRSHETVNPEKPSNPMQNWENMGHGGHEIWGIEDLRDMLTAIPRQNYGSWLRICSGAWNRFGESATPVLKEVWPPEKAGEYEEKYPVRLREVPMAAVYRTAIECGWKSRASARLQGFGFQVKATHRPMDGFSTTRCNEIAGSIETPDFVQGLLVEGAMSVIYGPSNCGKSFWSLHLAAAVAMGQPFFGREVEQGAVLYFGLEGKSGTSNRVAAMKQKGLLADDAPLHLCFSPLSLLDEKHAALVAATVSRIENLEGCKLKLIVIDTYARAMAGGDENSGKDTSEVVATVDAIRMASEAHVMLIHHCGKDEARGARGHSSLRAAADTEIEITRPDTTSPSVVSVKKQRDLPIAEITCFKLVPVHLGFDRRDAPITSCVVKHDEDCEVPTRRKGRPQKATEAEILALLPRGSSTAWQMAAKADLNVGKTAFYEHLKTIKASELAIQDDKGRWKVSPQFTDPFPNSESP